MTYFTTNSKNYTTRHNNMMDTILWACCGEDSLFSYDTIKQAYTPYYDTGDRHDEALKILEYLVELDLIEEVTE